MATPGSRPAPAKIGALPRVAVALYFLHLGVSLAIPIVLGWLTYRFLHRAEDTVPPFLAWLVALYPVVGRLWWLRLILAVAAYIAFTAWLYVRYREAANRGAPTRYRPHWAITGTLVPFLNLVRPYQVTSDAFRATAQLRQKETGQSRPVATPLVVKLWWGALLVTAVIGSIGGKPVLPGHMELDWILVSWYLGAAVTSALAIAVIAGLERERLGGDSLLLGPLPLGIGGFAAAALSVSLTLAGAYGLAMVEMGKLMRAESAGLAEIPPEVIPRGAVPPRPASSWQLEGEFTGSAIEVRWIGGGGTGYNVYRREADGTSMKLNAELVREPWFRDQETEPGHTYLYSVSAVDRWGDESPRSLEGSVSTPPAAGAEAYVVPPSMIGVPGGVPGGMAGGIAGGVVGGVATQEPTRKVAAPQRLRVSQGVMQGNLISQASPAYPPIAKAAKVSGSVVMLVIIATDGTVKDVRVMSGHPLLRQAATDAVRKWRYRPHMVAGAPTEVETTVTMNFVM